MAYVPRNRNNERGDDEGGRYIWEDATGNIMFYRPYAQFGPELEKQMDAYFWNYFGTPDGILRHTNKYDPAPRDGIWAKYYGAGQHLQDHPGRRTAKFWIPNLAIRKYCRGGDFVAFGLSRDFAAKTVTREGALSDRVKIFTKDSRLQLYINEVNGLNSINNVYVRNCNPNDSFTSIAEFNQILGGTIPVQAPSFSYDCINDPGTLKDAAILSLKTRKPHYAFLTDVSLMLQRVGAVGKGADGESVITVEENQEYYNYEIRGNAEIRRRRLVRTGGLNKGWQYKFEHNGEKFVAVCQRVELMYVGEIPHTLIQLISFPLNLLGNTIGYPGVQLIEPFGGKSEISNAKQVHMDLKNRSALDFIEAYSKRKAQAGDEIYDFVKRQKEIQTKWVELDNLMKQYLGDANTKLYETQSKVDGARNLKFINLEVRQKNWFGLELKKEVYSAPLLVVNDIFKELGTKVKTSQLEMVASNYIKEHDETRYYAYEALAIANFIKKSQRVRLETVEKTVRLQ